MRRWVDFHEIREVLDNSAFLFPSPSKQGHLTRHRIYALIKDIAAKAGDAAGPDAAVKAADAVDQADDATDAADAADAAAKGAVATA